MACPMRVLASTHARCAKVRPPIVHSGAPLCAHHVRDGESRLAPGSSRPKPFSRTIHLTLRDPIGASFSIFAAALQAPLAWRCRDEARCVWRGALLWGASVGRFTSFWRLVWGVSRLFAFGVAKSDLFAFGEPRQTRKARKTPHETRFGRISATRNVVWPGRAQRRSVRWPDALERKSGPALARLPHGRWRTHPATRPRRIMAVEGNAERGRPWSAGCP